VTTPPVREAAVVRTPREHLRAVGSCTACGLHGVRRRPVAGHGPPSARLVIVGPAPRRHEDLLGAPFAGASRNLLDHALAAVGIDAQQVRFTTAVRCRPPQDRRPTGDELVRCRPHLQAELRFLAPEVVVSLGEVATSALLGRPVVLERVAGYRLDILQGVTLVPTQDLADAVRGVPQAVEAIRRDLAVAKAVLDGRLRTGAHALAELRSRLAADERPPR
jgi:uracil-DNA glycosylase